MEETRSRLKRRTRLACIAEQVVELEARRAELTAERDRLLLEECADPERLPQTVLAQRAGVSPRWISKLERAAEAPNRPIGRPLGAVSSS